MARPRSNPEITTEATTETPEVVNDWKANFHTNVYTFDSQKELSAIQGLLNNELCQAYIGGQVHDMDEILAVEDITEKKDYKLRVTTRTGWLNEKVINHLKNKLQNSHAGIVTGRNAGAVNEFIKWNG